MDGQSWSRWSAPEWLNFSTLQECLLHWKGCPDSFEKVRIKPTQNLNLGTHSSLGPGHSTTSSLQTVSMQWWNQTLHMPSFLGVETPKLILKQKCATNPCWKHWKSHCDATVICVCASLHSVHWSVEQWAARCGLCFSVMCNLRQFYCFFVQQSLLTIKFKMMFFDS